MDHRDHRICLDRAWLKNLLINWTLWVLANLGHFRIKQKYFYLQNDLPYSADVEPYTKYKFDFIK